MENAVGQAFTVSGARETLTNVLVPRLQNLDLNSMWFQQDGATYHTARETVQVISWSCYFLFWKSVLPVYLDQRFNTVGLQINGSFKNEAMEALKLKVNAVSPKYRKI